MRIDFQALGLESVEGGAARARLQELACSNAVQVREQLLILLNRGARDVIVDLTDCAVVCECCGVPALIRANRRARALGARLGIAVPEESPTRQALERASRSEPFPLTIVPVAPVGPPPVKAPLAAA
ncbi:STAS domain-containing protein [Wenjunlia tyrosinilytica]|uniref:Uncharacterized protein n=1 Tax=Wenjunlia tyrosinilytica TaxID=1544741 RepID=A0A918DST9_9ACTN|nr:hypothetical protein [Wenjunlia tyrosinilytica]GGO80639.1 hypothetical protein GCM10012280_03030 [Wenjunlia tyrosinilytica]